MQDNVYGSGDVARLVGLPRWRLLYLIDKGRVPAPACQVPGRRLFTAEDVARIRESLDLLDADHKA